MKLITESNEIPENFTGCVDYTYGCKHWYVNSKLHREDGPAIVWDDGSAHWYKNNELHRGNGPAYEASDGSKFWFLNGQLHREDGPAIIWSDGSKEYWKNNKCVPKEQFLNLDNLNPDVVLEINGKKYKLVEQNHEINHKSF